ncbi:MAG: ferredoxin [Acidobacteria bacterium]|nr:ferredoxin [Acidobacteriota bacterium]
MAAKATILPENVSGRFSVNSECIDCDLCRQEAPANFTREKMKGYSYVSKQPANEAEQEQCEAALQTCPVDAIAKG